MGVSPTQRRQRKHQPTGPLSISPWAVETLYCGSVLRSESLLCCMDSPLSEPYQVYPSGDGITSLGDDCEPNFAAGISPTWGSKFASTVMGLHPLEDNIANSSRHFVPNQPCRKQKISIPEMHIPKTTGKCKPGSLSNRFILFYC